MDYLVEEIINKLSGKVDHSEVYLEQEKATEISVLNDEVNYAKEQGIDVIVTDHHRNGDLLPDAVGFHRQLLGTPLLSWRNG